MMRTRTIFIRAAFSLTAALCMPGVKAQEPVNAGVVSDLGQYRSQRLQEKVFLHTDKEFYLAGEICWFKLYAVEADSHHPLDLSKVAYLEWLDKDNRPVLQAKIGLSGGHGNGSVYLPMTLRSGNYKLRAYTSWMKNYAEDWFFEKMITVVNARRSAERPVAEAPLSYRLSLFPEGGNLVEKISSRVAFRITDQYGRGVSCKGFVTEDDQDTVVSFQPYKFGLGSFNLIPRQGHRYRATVRLEDGTAVSELLPAVYKEGVVMSVSEEGKDHFRVNIQSAAADGVVWLFVHTRQSVKLTETITLREGKASLLVDKSQLGDGISHFTLFNASRQPLCERLVFRFPALPLPIDVRSDREVYSTRQAVNLQIGLAGAGSGESVAGTGGTTKGEGKTAGAGSGKTGAAEGESRMGASGGGGAGASGGQAGMADCSVAVFRVDSLQTAPVDHIGSYLWLRSDLKGWIESPEYYFDHPEDAEAMDNVMLTHGWRRFRWEEVLHYKEPSFEFPPEYNGAIISGRILDARTGAAPGKVIQGYVSALGTMTEFSTASCDEQGRVKFELRNFYGGQELVAETRPWDSLYRIDIDNPFSEAYTENLLPPFLLAPDKTSLLEDKSVGTQVLNRFAGERLKRFHFPGKDSGTFYYKPDYSYKLDDYTRFTTMEEVLREYVTMMRVERTGGHFYLPLFDLSNQALFRDNPLILLDGMPVFNIDQFMALDPLKIRKLETVHRKYFFGDADYEGIMNWTSYKGDLAGYTPDVRATVLDYEGLQLQREFYSPSYAEGQQAEAHLPDFRNVLYWAPELSLHAGSKGALNFYTSDVPGKYVVVVEGMGADGRAGSGVYRFEVKKP